MNVAIGRNGERGEGAVESAPRDGDGDGFAPAVWLPPCTGARGFYIETSLRDVWLGSRRATRQI